MRYAIYWCPSPDDLLLAAGEYWLGRSVADASRLAQPAIAGMTEAQLAARTRSVGRYGFHATLKAPLRLKNGVGERQFLRAVAQLAGELAPFAMPPLTVGRLGGFLALRPIGDPTALGALAARIVTALDDYRRPLEEDELERRPTVALTTHEAKLLRRWGYPYVLDAYRFHVTLSDALEDADAAVLTAAARHHFAAALALPRSFNTLAVFVEPAPDAPLTLLARLPLGPGR